MLEGALQLAPRERAELVEALTASLDGHDLGEDWENEIRLRVSDVDAGRVKSVPGEEAFARVVHHARGFLRERARLTRDGEYGVKTANREQLLATRR